MSCRKVEYLIQALLALHVKKVCIQSTCWYITMFIHVDYTPFVIFQDFKTIAFSVRSSHWFDLDPLF